MRTPAEIKKIATNKYREFLRQHLAGGSIFPYDVDFGRPRSGRELDRIAQESRTLMEGSVAVVGYGYTVETEIVRTMYGEQRFPSRVYFPDALNYLRFIGKEAEWASIENEVRLIKSLVPGATSWARAHPMDVLAHAGQWNDLCLLLNYLLSHPRPGCYPRELPLPISGKLLGDEHRLVCDILSTIAGTHWRADEDYYAQLGLRRPPASFLRIRFLDPAVQTANGYPVADLAMSIDDLKARPLVATAVYVVENLMTFLAFPARPGAIVLFGEGNAASRLENLAWLNASDLIYWGDLDPFGFVILDRLRARFPGVRTILMDAMTFEKHRYLASAAAQPDEYALAHLQESERSLARRLFEDAIGLEQEKIPQFELLNALASEAATTPLPGTAALPFPGSQGGGDARP